MKSKKVLHKTRITNFQQSVRKRKRKINRRSVQMRMLRNFLTKGISAAGISHIATAKSPILRVFWFLATSLAVIMMVLTTYRILQEYWKYPKASQTKTFSVNSLEFPAVTICSRYLLPRMNAEEANLQPMNDIKPFLMNLPSSSVPKDHKEPCYEDPLCRWVKFLEKCSCDRNPCDTTLCYPERSADTCNCSRLLCSKEKLSKPEACKIFMHGGHEQCVCRRDFMYTSYGLNGTPLKVSRNKKDSEKKNFV